MFALTLVHIVIRSGQSSLLLLSRLQHLFSHSASQHRPELMHSHTKTSTRLRIRAGTLSCHPLTVFIPTWPKSLLSRDTGLSCAWTLRGQGHTGILNFYLKVKDPPYVYFYIYLNISSLSSYSGSLCMLSSCLLPGKGFQTSFLATFKNLAFMWFC